MPCGLASGYQRFEGTYRLYLQGGDGGDTLLQNVGNYLQVYTASQPRRPESTSSPP
jgi:hypothetical protein